MENLRLGRYQLIKKIASGGMADVYRAKLIGVEGFEKTVAIKKILPHWSHNREFVDMLIDEAKVLLHLTHSNIVQVYELGCEDDIYFIVMEYIEGVDLRTFLERLKKNNQKIPHQLARYIVQQVLQGLDFAHNKTERNKQSLHIVHRDISPQNILLNLEGGVKITDFGIARIVGKTHDTVTGTLKGKFAYMSPEQAIGQKVDARTDLFAVGILFYEMAMGKRCFKGTNDLETLEMARKAQVDFSDDLKEAPELKNILKKALQKNKTHRFQTADEFLQALSLLQFSDSGTRGDHLLKTLIAELFPEKMLDNSILTQIEDSKLHDSKPDDPATQIQPDTQKEEAPLYYRKTKIIPLEGLALRHTTDLPTYIEPETVMEGATRVSESAKGCKLKSDDEGEASVALPLEGARRAPLITIGAAVAVLLLAILLGGLAGKFKKPLTERMAGQLPPVALEALDQKKGQPEKTVYQSIQLTTLEKPIIVEAKNKMPQQTNYKASLNIQTEPPGSTITLQYDQKKESFLDEAHLNLTLNAPQELIIDVAKKGYHAVSEKIFLDADHREYEKIIHLKEMVYGSLRVNARPWGRVFISGVSSGSEVPFLSRQIPVGDHKLRIVYPPLQKSVSSNIHIKEKVLTQCLAIFGEKSSLNCY